MAISETRVIVLGLISKITTRPAEEVQSSGNLLRDYNLSSLQSVELFAAVEQRFGVVLGIEPDDMNALATVDTLTAWIDARVVL
jgi:acyl carrier protein